MSDDSSAIERGATVAGSAAGEGLPCLEKASDRNPALDGLAVAVADFIDSVFSNSEMADYPCREWLVHQFKCFYLAHIAPAAPSPTAKEDERG